MKTFKIVLITILSTILFILLLLGIWFVKLAIQPPPFLLETNLPKTVMLKDTALVDFTIYNQNSKKQIVESVDIYKSFLNNFDVVWQSANVDSVRESINFISFYLQDDIEAKDSIFMQLKIKGKTKGTFSGDLMVMTPKDEITHSAIGLTVE
jgi:hypothetical protein